MAGNSARAGRGQKSRNRPSQQSGQKQQQQQATGTTQRLAAEQLLRRELAARNEAADIDRGRHPRFDDDDAHAPGDEPDLGVRDGDDPWTDDRENDGIRLIRPIAEIMLSMNGREIEYEVRAIEPDRLAALKDAHEALKRFRKLTAVAHALAKHLDGVDLNLDLSDLWEALPYATQDQFAQLASEADALVGEKAETSAISRVRGVLVGLPGVLVPLGFFFDKVRGDAAVKLIADLLREDPRRTKAELQRRVAAAGLGDSVSNAYAGWVQSVTAFPDVVAQFAAAFRQSPGDLDALIDRLAHLLLSDVPQEHHLGTKPFFRSFDNRKPALIRAIVGGL